MVIYLAGDVDEEVRLDEMTPRQIVTELDKHVIGQRNAKRAVAIALRRLFDFDVMSTIIVSIIRLIPSPPSGGFRGYSLSNDMFHL